MKDTGTASGWAFQETAKTGYFTIEAFEKTGLVALGFSTRLGGVSRGPFASLNQGLHVADDPRLVIENRRLLSEAVGIDINRLVVTAQVHGDRVYWADRSDAGAGATDLESSIPDCDAMITQETDLPLVTHHADCVALLILDPINRAIGIAHAGWKGTLLKIGSKTINAMERDFGTRPGDCLVGISPSIGPCCYEVDAPVLEQFAAAFSYYPELIRPRPNLRASLDLWEANRRPLVEIGVREENIITSRFCTCCTPQYFYSYRREAGGVTGRMAAFIMLKGRHPATDRPKTPETGKNPRTTKDINLTPLGP